MSQSTSPESNDKEVQGITRISVQGFKSLYDECSIEIRPLTILAGANSSGKSSIMQPLLLMKQTLEAPYDPGALLLNGPNVRFTANEQIFSQFKSKKNICVFSTNIEIDQSKSLFQKFKTANRGKLTNFEIKHKEGEKENRFWKGMARQEILYFLTEYYQNKNESIGWIIQNTGEMVDHLEYSINLERCFLDLTCKSKICVSINTEESTLLDANLYDSHSHTNLFKTNIRKMIHLPGLRGNPERTYPTTAIGSEFPGTFENYVASIINEWQESNDKHINHLNKTLEIIGLPKIEAVQVNDVQVELRIGRFSIADVGIGVSQVLPVLVGLLVAKTGQLVYIEQPELHLHPRAQAALANILADAAKRGVRVVIETHSELLLLAVQSLVAERQLSPDLVKLHWFTRGDDGMTKVSSADLDEAGAFGDFPEDFSDVSLKLESRYLNAAESRLSEGSSGS
ncbi:AAA family ATPase [Coleofasciculus chthonoplastes]|uniref:AAA family ATPase n=1 Tax=Coleofasciculus chthonoplastes TaxID=64178 RepID=UPI0032FA9E1E